MMSTARCAHRLLVLVAVLSVLAACTTTKREAASNDAGAELSTGGGGDTGAAPSEPSALATDTTVATPTPGAAAGTGPAAGNAAVSGPAPATAGGAGAAQRPAAGLTCGRTAGRGVTAETITIGFMHSSDVGQANRSIGGNQWREGEPKSFGDAYIDYFNKTGGLCGRRIEPVWIDEHLVTGASPDANDQAACTALTQDHKVFASMSLGSYRPARLSCLARAGVIAVDVSSLLSGDADEAKQYGNFLYQPYKFTLDRFFPIYVDQLAKAGYFDKGARVGLLYTDIPAEERAVRRTLIPALRAKGIEVVQQARIAHTYGIDSYAAAQAQTNNAVLSFQTSRVTHVLAPVDSYSFGSFVERAEQQNYRPRYGISYSTTSGIRGGQATLGPHVQYEGAVMVTWAPALGLAEAWALPGNKECLDILRAQGHAPPNDWGTLSFTYCDFLTFMRAALERAVDLTPAGLHAAAAGLGQRTNGFAWSWQLDDTRHDGANAIRVVTYSGGEKGTWRYITPLIAVG